MGIPPCSIYAAELVEDYGVKTVIRVGCCGALIKEIKLGEITIAMGVSTDSKVNRMGLMDHDYERLVEFVQCKFTHCESTFPLLQRRV